MGEGTDGVEAPPAASATGAVPAVPPSASPGGDDDAARTQDPDNNAKNKAGAAAGDQDQQLNQEAEAAGKAHGAGGSGSVAQAEEKPTPGTGASWPATPPGTRTPPERDVAPPPRTGARNAQAAETEPDVETAKPGPGCATPPPPPSEASDDGRGSPLHEGKPPGASVAAASRSRLLGFRSFSRDKKANKSDTAEHKEKGKERRKRFWK